MALEVLGVFLLTGVTVADEGVELVISDAEVPAVGARGASVCGHCLLAQHHGWGLSVLAMVVKQGLGAGCG